MFLGHFAVAFAAKKAAPRVSLGTLFAAAQLADLAWPVLVLAGVERFAIEPGNTAVTPLDFQHYPYSHSLVALVAWGVAFTVLHRIFRRDRWQVFAVLALLVVSHWFLDALVHRADMPLTPSEQTKVGLGIWNSVPATMVLEGAVFAAGVALYWRMTRARDRIGRFGLGALAGFLAIVYAANLFGPPPPSTDAVAWSCLAMWLIVAWGGWVDRHREAR